MNIDKFGNLVHKRLRHSENYRNIRSGINRDADGNIDMLNAQIKKLSSPTEESDAATKLYVDSAISGLNNTLRQHKIDIKNQLDILNEQLRKIISPLQKKTSSK